MVENNVYDKIYGSGVGYRKVKIFGYGNTVNHEFRPANSAKAFVKKG